MRKRRIGILEWESMVNTIPVTEQENKHLDILVNDSLQSIQDSERGMNEVALIKQKYDRAYYVKTKK